MKVIVMRHSKVKYIWSKWYTSDEFDKACKEYDRAPIEYTEQNITEIDYKNIYISTLLRSKETAISIFGKVDLRQTVLIDEVPLRSTFDSKIRFPLWFWNFTGRLQWFLNITRQIEGRFNTRERAKSFVNMLCKDGENAIVVTHGFFMYTLLNVFKEAGFRYDKSYVYYKNGSYAVVEK
jgi:hypothetical protein